MIWDECTYMGAGYSLPEPTVRGKLWGSLTEVLLAFALAHHAGFDPGECFGEALWHFNGRNKPNLLPSVCFHIAM